MMILVSTQPRPAHLVSVQAQLRQHAESADQDHQHADAVEDADQLLTGRLLRLGLTGENGTAAEAQKEQQESEDVHQLVDGERHRDLLNQRRRAARGTDESRDYTPRSRCYSANA